MKKLLLLTIALWLTACSGPKFIPEEKMQAIITESLISEAIARNMVQKASYDERKTLDSIDFYAPVLSKYGYTITDFGYTAAEMAIRKSNPLDNIMTNVLDDLKRRDDMATYIYNQMKKFDTITLKYYADTVYKKDTLIKGNFSKLKIPAIKNAKEGKYIVTFDYCISSEIRLETKTLRYKAIGGEAKNAKVNSQFWMNRNGEDEKFTGEVDLKGNYDKLIFTFEESKPTGINSSNIKDTSTMSNIMIVYYPEITKARLEYLNNEILQIDEILSPDDKYKPKDFGSIPTIQRRKAD